MSKRGKPSWGLGSGDEIATGRTVQAVLGGGERYEAYIAWNHRLMTPTVIKLLRPSVVADGAARRSLVREARMLGRLQHPGLTRLFDVDAEGERPFLEIEYVEGPRLSTLVRRHGPLNPEQALSLGQRVAAAVSFLHSQGILHLDVKPSNIIMGSAPRLIDLSVARRAERAHLVNGFVGTDAYMSPEQADPTLWSTIGPKSDTWGLGATLYHAIANRHPHSRGRHEAAGADRFPQLVEEPAPLDQGRHSAGVVELIMGAMRRDPAARPSAEELSDRLDDLATFAGVGTVRFR